MNVEMLTYIREAEANAFAANLLLPDDVSKFQIMSSMNAFQIKKLVVFLFKLWNGELLIT